ncbi:hypothetical protein QBC43DRAFT_285378 [Cladorrhinum sp. PSN259]|nr:hypothetical protein QBC43DRAFT_285378 [Cladorrhinum sp. PSN259]
MASPVSLGDVIAMSKIAWKIAQAFSKGRNSAPAGFREVENQLYSLSRVLDAFSKAFTRDSDFAAVDAREGASIIKRILDNCKDTLTRLQETVDKYGDIVAVNDPAQSLLKRWGTGFKKNYRKVAWTTKAGDLATLRGQLMAHTNSLDLVVGIIIKQVRPFLCYYILKARWSNIIVPSSSRTSRMEDALETNLQRLTDIHNWWAENLRDVPSSIRQDTPEPSSHSETPRTTLAVHILAGNDTRLLCPKASLNDDWALDGSSSPLFVYNCGLKVSHTQLTRISLSSISFPFRQAGIFDSWTLYKVLDRPANRLVTLSIKINEFTEILDFEYCFIKPLSATTVKAMLQQGITNNLAHLTPDSRGIRSLCLQSDLKKLYNLTQSVCFRVGDTVLTKDNIARISLLRFQEIHQERVDHGSPGLEFAELVIYYTQKDPFLCKEDVTKTVLHILHHTRVDVIQRDASVAISGVECIGFVPSNQTIHLKEADVTFQMASLEAAAEFHRKVEEMKQELFITALEYPRPDEIVVLPGLHATKVHCEVVMIREAELVVTCNQSGKSRLIISSWNRCTVLVQELNEDFFVANTTPSFASSTWLIQVEDDGQRRIYHHPNGFRFLRFETGHFERMFDLARDALSQSANRTQLELPVRQTITLENREDHQGN